jgi:hypothetical protein
VPVFTDAASLERAIAMPTADRDALVERLHAVVVERHSYAARAEQVRSSLDAAVERADGRTGDRAPLLRWATLQREELRETAHERDVHRSGVHQINERLIVSEEAVAVLDRGRRDADAARQAAESERDAIALRYEALTRSAEYRVLDRIGRVARRLRQRG